MTTKPFTVLYYTDVHYDDRNPRSRIDDYPAAILAKIRDIANLRIELKPDLVIGGGDLFNRAKHSIQMALDVGDAMDVPHYFDPIHEVIGNHLWQGCWKDWRDRSAMRVLERMGLLILYEKEFIYKVNDKYTIHTEHKSYTRYPTVWDGSILYKDYTGPGNVFLVSDFHPMQGDLTVNGVRFISPGAVSRGSAIETDMQRQPCVAYMTFTEDDLKVRFIKLDSAKPGGDVLSPYAKREVTKEEQATDTKIGEAINEVKKYVNQVVVFSTSDCVKFVAKKANIDKDTVEKCLSRIEKN